jgi:chromosome segregation ATPase
MTIAFDTWEAFEAAAKSYCGMNAEKSDDSIIYELRSYLAEANNRIDNVVMELDHAKRELEFERSENCRLSDKGAELIEENEDLKIKLHKASYELPQNVVDFVRWSCVNNSTSTRQYFSDTHNGKIQQIKALRDLLGSGLKEIKEFIEGEPLKESY